MPWSTTPSVCSGTILATAVITVPPIEHAVHQVTSPPARPALARNC